MWTKACRVVLSILLLHNVNCASVGEKMVLKETAPTVSVKHIRNDAASVNVQHTVVFAVKQNNLDQIESVLNDVSNPHSLKYGHHLTKSQVVALTANPTSSQLVIDYLNDHGVIIDKTTKNREYIFATATVGKWNELLNTEFYEYSLKSHPDVKVVRTTQYSLSEHIAEHVSLVANTVQLPDEELLLHQRKKISSLKRINKQVLKPMKKNKFSTKAAPVYEDAVTPAVLNAYYNITSNAGNKLASQAVYEMGEAYFSPSDLSTFQTTFLLPQQPVYDDINGHADDAKCTGEAGFNNCGESNLDLQYITAVSQVTNTTYYYNSFTGHDAFLDWITQVVNMTNPPLVFSISYGAYENGFTEAYMQQFNIEAMKAGAMGITIMSSAGDNGAPGSNAKNDANQCGYFPQFPASSPYITTVGGTMGPQNGTEEVLCTSIGGGTITGGGGFSNLNVRPQWQNTAVSAYLAGVSTATTPPQPGYNTTGRGYPDVTALAANYVIVIGGQVAGVSGTSASSPVFAGMVSLVNAKRLAAGKSALGWINPALYTYSSQILKKDITSGENNCVEYTSATQVTCCAQGFYAVPGWDPASGLGSVDFSKFSAVFSNLGSNSSSASPSTAPSAAPVISVAPTMVNNWNSTIPSTAPTSAGSQTPTNGVVQSPGWFYQYYYDGTGCVGNVTQLGAVQTQKCFAVFNATGGVTNYSKYTCNGGQGMSATYSDAACTQVISTSPPISLTCSASVSNMPYSAVNYSVGTYCSNTMNLPFPVLQSTTQFSTQYFYDTVYTNKSSCSTTPSSFQAFASDYCFANGTSSYKFTIPSMSLYTDSNCNTVNYIGYVYLSNVCLTNTPLTANVPAANHYPWMNNIGYTDLWAYYSAGPTSAPTLAPTRAPTYSKKPTSAPSAAPTNVSNGTITTAPSASPNGTVNSMAPSAAPTNASNGTITLAPSAAPNGTVNSMAPSAVPTNASNGTITVAPSAAPNGTVNSMAPTAAPTNASNGTITVAPSAAPNGTVNSMAPSAAPTNASNGTITTAPSASPNGTVNSMAPSAAPTNVSNGTITTAPSASPNGTVNSMAPSAAPTNASNGTITTAPSASPNGTVNSMAPTAAPTNVSNGTITTAPSASPNGTVNSMAPSAAPTNASNGTITLAPSAATNGTVNSMAPSAVPSQAPNGTVNSMAPSAVPSQAPNGTVYSMAPSAVPTLSPSSATGNSSSSSPSLAPSNVPSNRTSSAPTIAPSTPSPTAPQTYFFAVTQNLNGISSSQYNADLATNNAVFTSSVAASMTGISASNVVVNSVTAGTSRRNRRLQGTGGNSCVVNYVVNYDLVQLGYAGEPQTAYNSLTSQLDTAVTSGNFTTTLQNTATTQGATNLATATSTSVEEGPYTPTGTSSGGGNNNDDNTTTIIIAVCVSIGGVLLLGAVAYFLYFRKASTGTATSASHGSRKDLEQSKTARDSDAVNVLHNQF